MNSSDGKGGPGEIAIEKVEMREASAPPANDDGSGGGGPDTTALVAHADVVDAIRGTLVRRGRRRHLEDDVPEVQLRALAAARSGPMPLNVAEWRALAAEIATRYATRVKTRAKARALYDTGLCEEPDAHGPIEKEPGHDPVDAERYLGVLKSLFDEAKMPEMGAEILWAVAEGVSRREAAEETGLTEQDVKYRLERMRALFAARIAQLGLVALVLVFFGCAMPRTQFVAGNDTAPTLHEVG